MVQRRAIALGGFMGVGKTTVGRLVADELGWPFVDLDAVLTARHGPIVDQFVTDGEARFRIREADLVAELCDGAKRVLATGGGTWMHPESRRLLREGYRTVVLEADLTVLRARVRSEGRPLWGGDLAARLAKRLDAYRDAEHHIDTSHRTPREATDAVLRLVDAP